jgi:hypothetical protein
MGNGSQYVVHVRGRSLRGRRFSFIEPFGGDRAYSDASDFFQSQKERADVVEVQLTRLDGGDWQYVDAFSRDAAEVE